MLFFSRIDSSSAAIFWSILHDFFLHLFFYSLHNNSRLCALSYVSLMYYSFDFIAYRWISLSLFNWVYVVVNTIIARFTNDVGIEWAEHVRRMRSFVSKQASN